MRSPRSTSRAIQNCSKQRLSTLPESPCDFQCHPSKINYQNNIQAYYKFKQALLRSMAIHDPLEILQLGIFEQYQKSFITIKQNSPLAKGKKKEMKAEAEISNFDNIINSYIIDQNLRITQVERKSLSCQKYNKDKNLKRKFQEQRNVQFVIFSNYLQKIRLQTKDPQDLNEDSYINILTKSSQSQGNKPQKLVLSKKLQQIQQQNIEIKEKFAEINFQLQNQKYLTANAITEKNDRQLQFLLKEKLMNKRLLDAKEEIQSLKGSLDMLQQQISRLHLPAKSKQNQQLASQFKKRSLGSIKEKLENQSKFKILLSELSKIEFQSICQHQK